MGITLKMDAMRSCETLVYIHKNTQTNKEDEKNLNYHCRENFQQYKLRTARHGYKTSVKTENVWSFHKTYGIHAKPCFA